MSGSSGKAGDLARLLETERRLGERLRVARAEAEALVSRAQADAARREAALAAELEVEQRRAEERLKRDQHKREREIADSARRQIDAYDRVPPERLAAVAQQLARRLAEEDGAP